MKRVTFIADVELHGTDEDDPSLLFGAAVVDAAKSLDVSDMVSIQFFEDDEGGVHIGVAVPATKEDTSEQAKILLDEALSWFNYKAACPEFLLTTCH